MKLISHITVDFIQLIHMFRFGSKPTKCKNSRPRRGNHDSILNFFSKAIWSKNHMNRMAKEPTERDRLISNKRANIDILNEGNNMMYDEIAYKTERMLDIARNMNNKLDEDAMILRNTDDSLSQGDIMMNKGVRFVKDITDDPTGLGIMKIAMLVFFTLCSLYFGGKIIFKIIRLFKSSSTTHSSK